MFTKCFLLLLGANFLAAGLVPLPESRIIGGTPIDIKQAPYQISLRLRGQHNCGGSIYNNRSIITAAHCMFGPDGGRNYTMDELSVSVGSSAKSKGAVFGVLTRVTHPDYTNGSPNDIAVLRLSKPLVFSDTVQPIALAKEQPVVGAIASATGWGATDVKGQPPRLIYPEYLQGIGNKIELDCQKYYMDPVANSSICTLAGICGGDSGGPLVANRELVGIVSTSNADCNGHVIYANVFQFRNWFIKTVAELDERYKN